MVSPCHFGTEHSRASVSTKVDANGIAACQDRPVDVMERARKAFEAAGVPFEVEEPREGAPLDLLGCHFMQLRARS